MNISPIYYARAVFNVFGGLVREADGKEVNWQEGEEIFQKEIEVDTLGTDASARGAFLMGKAALGLR